MPRSRAKSPRLVMCLTTTSLSSTLRDVRVGDDGPGGHGAVDQLARINEVYKVLDKRERKKVFGRRDNSELYILSVCVSWPKILGVATHFECTAIHFFNIFLVLAEARPCFVRSALKSTIRVNELSDEGRLTLGTRLGAEDLDFNANRVIICIIVSQAPDDTYWPRVHKTPPAKSATAQSSNRQRKV